MFISKGYSLRLNHKIYLLLCNFVSKIIFKKEIGDVTFRVQHVTSWTEVHKAHHV